MVLAGLSLRTRSRHISFSSTVSEKFVVHRGLTEGLVEEAIGYWKSKGMAIKNLRKPDTYSAKEPAVVEFVAEGGTIWTTSFDSYKKTIIVNLSGSTEQTDVMVQLVLPGGLMSLQDRERAAELIESFYKALE